jgi:hypothetical protein
MLAEPSLLFYLLFCYALARIYRPLYPAYFTRYLPELPLLCYLLFGKLILQVVVYLVAVIGSLKQIVVDELL